jgi:Icc protein
MAGAVLRLAQITDCHVPAGEGETFLGVDAHGATARVVEAIAAGDYDAVLATGDLAADGSTEAYRRVGPLLARVGVPVFVVPGNHDEVDVMRRALIGGAVREEAAWNAGGWRILFLDTTIRGRSHGHLGRERLAALDAALLAKGTQPVLVCLHHNPVLVGGAADYCPLADGPELLALLDRHDHVRGLVWGHAHCAFDATRRGVRLMGTPSSAAQFPTQPGALATIEPCPGYRTLELHPDGDLRSEVRWVRGAGA